MGRGGKSSGGGVRGAGVGAVGLGAVTGDIVSLAGDVPPNLVMVSSASFILRSVAF